MTSSRQSGFTLIEVLVAMAILAVVVLQFLATRTAALVDAADARNWRIAREIAETQLSQLRAGAHEIPPENRLIQEVGEDYPGFRYQILIGESAISEAETEFAESYSSTEDRDSADRRADRQSWQRERDTLRRARQSGLSFSDYENQLIEEELEDRLPSEDEFEDVAVVVYFPNLRASEEDDTEFANFMLKAKVSTMAIEGLTPEQAEQVIESRGGDSASGSSPLTGGQ